jgi:predicted AlkP superfamily phosphohydrolase/phosphomutase
LEITLDSQGFTILNQNFKQQEATGIITDKKKFDPLIEALSKKLASIKRHFLASPFEMMLELIRANTADKGNRTIPNFSFYLKADKREKIWIALESTQTFIEKLNLQYILD